MFFRRSLLHAARVEICEYEMALAAVHKFVSDKSIWNLSYPQCGETCDTAAVDIALN